MAETRKHKITVRDELDAQLLAQLGDDPVRPYEAGHFHRNPDAEPSTPDTPRNPRADEKPRPTASGLITPPGVVGAFTFTTKQPPTKG